VDQELADAAAYAKLDEDRLNKKRSCCWEWADRTALPGIAVYCMLTTAIPDVEMLALLSFAIRF